MFFFAPLCIQLCMPVIIGGIAWVFMYGFDSKRRRGPRTPSPVVPLVSGGAVQGFRQDGVLHFLGVPFALADRFKKPRDPEPITGVLTCDARGPACPQRQMGLVYLGEYKVVMLLRVIWWWVWGLGPFNRNPRRPAPIPRRQAEELGGFMYKEQGCLNLNVWTPDVTTSSAKLPVMVWLHGGSFFAGSGSEMAYDGAVLATEGNVVVVGINYRLGPLGFLSVEGGDDNCGLWDQIHALEWVQREIGQFGGDPGRVTLFGESAGAMSIGCLLASPVAQPLFAGAILQSGAASRASTRAEASAVAQEFANALGLPKCTRAALANVPAAACIAAMNKIMFDTKHLIKLQPVIDGVLLPEFPVQAIRAGSAKGKNLIVGVTKDETSLFEVIRGPAKSEGAVRGMLLAGMGRGADAHPLVLPRNVDAEQVCDELLDEARSVGDGSVKLLGRVVIDGLVFGVPARLLLEAQAPYARVWRYRFDHHSSIFADAAGHAIDVPFTFGSYDIQAYAYLAGGTPSSIPAIGKLGRELRQFWTHFAWHGCPAPLGRKTVWPSYNEQPDNAYLFDTADPGSRFRPVHTQFEDLLTDLMRPSKVPLGLTAGTNPNNAMKSNLEQGARYN